jgi:hypothetical protein
VEAGGKKEESSGEGWRENVAYFLLPLIGIAGAIVTWLTFASSIILVRERDMPRDAVLRGLWHYRPEMTLMILTIASISAGLLLSIVAVRGIPFLRNNLRPGTLQPGGPGPAIVCLCAAVLCYATALGEGTHYASVSPDGLFMREGPFGAPRHYSWTQVRKIETSCYRRMKKGARTWFYYAGFSIVMDDGRAVDLAEINMGPSFIPTEQHDYMTDYSGFFRAYPALAGHLRGVPFHYNVSFSANEGSVCPEQWRPYFAIPPK